MAASGGMAAWLEKTIAGENRLMASTKMGNEKYREKKQQ